MSRQVNITTNTEEVFKKFKELSLKEMRKVLKKALNSTASKLKSNTKKTFKRALPNAGKKGRYADTLQDAVRRSKIEENKNGEMSVKVHIMGSRNTGSGTYRAKFFETGTGQRKTRKGYNRGAIKPLHFFKQANSGFNKDYENTFNSELNKAIEKINKTKI